MLVVDVNDFDRFTVSTEEVLFELMMDGYDKRLYGHSMRRRGISTRTYQNMLALAVVTQNVAPGSRILDIGGGRCSLMIRGFQDDYECWCIDPLEGSGGGPTEWIGNVEDGVKIKLVEGKMGEFHEELPNDYFDLVYSVSTLEHVQSADEFPDILADMQRVAKPGALHFHCIDVRFFFDKQTAYWGRGIVPYLFEQVETLNSFVDVKDAKTRGLYTIPQHVYDRYYKYKDMPFHKYGFPVFYNIVWREPGAQQDL